MTRDMRILAAFGGNLPFGASLPAQTILAALEALPAEGLEVKAISRMYSTPAFPTGSGPDYTNAAAVLTLRHAVDPHRVLQALHRIEARFGRERHGRWQGRTLDIDLIAVGDSVSPDIDGYLAWQRIGLKDQAKSAPLGLILPHPRLQDRAFVLVPLADVAPDWCHPVLGQTVDQMLAALPKPDRNAVVAVNGSNFSGLALVNRGERP